MNETENLTQIICIQERLKDKESKIVSMNDVEEQKIIDDHTITEIVEDLNLLKDVKINKDILKQTKIGITVNKFTKVNNNDIQNISTELIEKWKNIAIKEKNSKSVENLKKRKSEKVDDSVNNACLNESEIKKVKVQNTLNNNLEEDIHKSKGNNKTHSYSYNDNKYMNNNNKCEQQDNNKNSKVSDQNSYQKNNEGTYINADIKALNEWNYNGKFHNDVHRDKAKQFLFKAFLSGSDDNLLHLIDRKKLNDIIYNIENELHRIFIEKKDSQKEYNMQLKSIKFNLCDKKNPIFNEKVYGENISARTLATMNSQDMASDEKKNERKKCLQESLLACQSDWDVKNILLKKTRKGEFQCFKCKGYETVYHQLQTRSSDEPMTTFVTCLKCNNRWKF
ncbi:transcription elongation factor s-II, putative [Plasmodium malariae]|uniref:Transcription elongation factor s-II, putative n=1 Tax=Plasmodium malariae TaxID=5858 RepID=A0A1A8WEI5_PLAMA|nr:transcription elongation factor s-II, putative [Plasmodium malariae]SBS90459.1 transcription elongation factor, putative [Plasmodium malariae]SCP03341.1 transcription elongation factor s-II, putative [Plasmodium malariae]